MKKKNGQQIRETYVKAMQLYDFKQNFALFPEIWLMGSIRKMVEVNLKVRDNQDARRGL